MNGIEFLNDVPMGSAGMLVYASGASGIELQPTMRINWLVRHAPTTVEQREYAQERCVAAGTEAIAIAMETAGLNRAELAERLGKSRAFVTRVLNGTHNMTLRTLGDMLWACDMEVRQLDVRQLGVIEVSAEDALEWEMFNRETSPDSGAPVLIDAAQAYLSASSIPVDVQLAA